MNPNKESDRRDLMSAVEYSRWKFHDIVEARRKLLRRSSGSEWYPDGAKQLTPINQMSLTENAYIQNLIGGEPRALVVANNSELELQAYEQSQALNVLSQQVSLRRKLKRIVRDAIYGIGICRIGMTAGKYVQANEIFPEMDEEYVGIGQLTLDVISLESWVHDCMSDTLEKREFCGHSYWVRAEDIGNFLPGVAEKDLIEEEKRWIDEHGSDMAGAISRGTEGEGQASTGKKYWLWDLWLPRENQIVTVPVNGTGEIANVRPWNSRPGGPYMFLFYQEVADQAVPKSVMSDLALVHDSLNAIFMKLINQAKNQKSILGFKAGHEDDAERIRDATSRAIIQMRDPSAVQEFNFNGPDQAMLATFLQFREIASIMGRNSDSLAGLTAQAPTLGQEEMLQSNASVWVQAMEQDTLDFVTEVYEAMRWYLYHEQEEPIPITYELENSDIRLPGEFSAQAAQDSPGTFDAFAMRINPYSLKYRSPEQRLRQILELWQGVFMPAIQMGLTPQVPDMDRLFEIIAQYSDLPELKGILRYLGSQEEQMQSGGGGEARQSPVTTRNYVRHGAPGPSQNGMAMQAMQMMNQGQPAGAAG